MITYCTGYTRFTVSLPDCGKILLKREKKNRVYVTMTYIVLMFNIVVSHLLYLKFLNISFLFIFYFFCIFVDIYIQIDIFLISFFQIYTCFFKSRLKALIFKKHQLPQIEPLLLVNSLR